MSRRILVFLSPLAFLACGCSQTPSSPSSAQLQRAAAQSAIDSMTGNARRSRDTGRTLKEESDKLLAQKNYNRAMEKRLEILAQRTSRSSLLSTLASYATQSLAIADLEKVASHLDGPACRKYAEQLKVIDAQKPNFAQILDAQKADELKMLTRITRTPKDWQQVVTGLGFSAQEQKVLSDMPAAQVESNIKNVYAALGKWAQQPYSSKPAPASGDPYTRKFAVSQLLDLSRFLWAKNKAERLLTIVALQQRADRLEKKQKGWTLPADPFGTGPFKEKSRVVYSVGADTKDDGGQSVPAPKRIQITDKGDILAPVF